MILKYLKIFLTGILVSLYFFPFEFSFLPGINTKMAMAAFGLLLVAYSLVKKRAMELPKNLFGVLLCSCIVSTVGFFSTTYNVTTDYAYASYIISASVWLSAGYVVCSVIKMVHSELNYKLLITYLATVCVVQCILALIIDNVPAVKAIVDTYILQDQAFLNKAERLYGIGASLDVAGSRFAAVMVLIACLLYYENNILSRFERYYYIVSMAVIFVIGNIIARTTTVGLLGVAIVIAIYYITHLGENMVGKSPILRIVITSLIIVVPVVVVLYNNSPVMRGYMNFAFEGFFSLVETGKWQTSSNDVLASMVVFPDNAKTWIIGDGYFVNPRGDINYVGTSTTAGYYMGTDIGYLRFIFYFGIIGLLSMCLVMAFTALSCAHEDQEHKLYFLLVLLTCFVVWLKVATDLFLVLVLFLCVINMREPIAEGAGDNDEAKDLNTV